LKGTLSHLLARIKSGLVELYGSYLREVYLYGSYARGEQQLDSDVDVLIVLEDFSDYGAEVDRTGELISTLSLEYGVSVSRVFVSAKNWATSENFFLRNVRHEAIPT
jgi:uncharacterized protein